MAATKEQFFARQERVRTAIRVEAPDRVPIMPKMNFFYGACAGISAFETMSDYRNCTLGVRQYLSEFSPDGVWAPAQYPIGALEALDPTFIRWPGPRFGLPLDSTFQISDDVYLEEEEYGEFIFDPTNFILTKWMPRRNRALKGLGGLSLQNCAEYSFFSALAKFDQPEVRQAFEAIFTAARESQRWLEAKAGFTAAVEAMGFPMGPALGQIAPFDILADNFRGVINAICDIKERPEELLEAVGVLERITIERGVSAAAAAGVPYVFMPLHMGIDEFMSTADYEKFYWPSLRNLMLAYVQAGITPFVFCEGNYNSRLEVIRDVPKGKVVYLFEKTNMREVKRKLGDRCCICGNVSTADLLYGDRQKVIDQTKELIDVCAPGGGFIMDVTIPVDKCKKENLHAMFETTELYGRY